MQNRERAGLTWKDMKSILKLLEEVERKFSSEYKMKTINGQNCFISESGTIFYFGVLKEFRTLIVLYAENMEEAQKNKFDEGDQFDIDQDLDMLIADIREELAIEIA